MKINIALNVGVVIGVAIETLRTGHYIDILLVALGLGAGLLFLWLLFTVRRCLSVWIEKQIEKL